MITVELTQTQIDHLTEGAEQFGRCSIILESTDGDAIFVVVSKTARRGRPRKPAGESAAGAAGGKTLSQVFAAVEEEEKAGAAK
jgi:hypothetical protein